MKATAWKKLKIAGTIIGVTIGVYIMFKYILPLAAPFVIALIIAGIIDRPVGYLTKKLHIKRTLSVIIMIIVVMAVIAGVIFGLGRILIGQIQNFISGYDKYMAQIENIMCGFCGGFDGKFGLSDGTSYNYVCSQVNRLVSQLTDSAGTVIMNSSMNLLTWFTLAFTAVAFTIMATVFFSQDMEKMRAVTRQSIFKEEVEFLTVRLKNILGTYVKTQLLIMTLTCIICTIGLYFMGNSYALLIGVLIGIIDAFPVLGTGTVFIPWAVILIIMGRYKSAAAIFAIYTICYYSREFLEPRLMGHKLGVSPLMMLMALYAGLLLFGIWGVITGPIAAILIKEISTQIIKNL